MANSFTNEISAAFDSTASYLGLWYLYEGSGWQLAPPFLGVWGIRSSVSYAGIDVTYNIYRDDIEIATDLSSGMYIDENVSYNSTYEYILDVVFSNGAVAKDTLSISLIPDTVYDLPEYDDGSFEVNIQFDELRLH